MEASFLWTTIFCLSSKSSFFCNRSTNNIVISHGLITLLILVLIWIAKIVYVLLYMFLWLSCFNDTKTKMYELSVTKIIPLHMAESYLIYGNMEWNKVIVIVPT